MDLTGILFVSAKISEAAKYILEIYGNLYKRIEFVLYRVVGHFKIDQLFSCSPGVRHVLLMQGRVGPSFAFTSPIRCMEFYTFIINGIGYCLIQGANTPVVWRCYRTTDLLTSRFTFMLLKMIFG